MAKKPKKKSAGGKKSAKTKKKGPGFSLGSKLSALWPLGSGRKKRKPGTPNDELYLEMLDAGLLDDGSGGEPEHPDAVEAAEEIEDSGVPWPEERLHIAQEIWGKDFIKPGGSADVVELIRPLALNSDLTVLDIGAGLGGSSRTIASETGAWVNGYELNEDLAAAAMERSNMAGMGRKAPVALLPPEGPGLKPRSANAMFSKEALYKVEDKEMLLTAVNDILRPQSQILLTDYVSAEGHEDASGVHDWMEHERTPSYLWTIPEYRAFFEKMDYRIHVAEDITDKYYHTVVMGFSAFSNTIKSFRGNTEMEQWTVKEAEFWARRMAPFEAGDLRVCRVFAQKSD